MLGVYSTADSQVNLTYSLDKHSRGRYNANVWFFVYLGLAHRFWEGCVALTMRYGFFVFGVGVIVISVKKLINFGGVHV